MSLQFWAEFLVSRFFRIVPMLAGVFAYWWTLRAMSASSHISTSKWLEKIDNDPQAMAHYLGLRNIGVALLMGLCAIAGAIAADLT